MIEKNNIIQILCLYFLFLLNLIFLFCGFQSVCEFFNNISSFSYISFNWPLIFSRFIELIITCSLMGYTTFKISKIKTNNYEYNSLLITYFFINVVTKLIENLVYFINLASLVDVSFFNVLSLGSIINIFFSLVIILTYFIFLIKRKSKIKMYIIGSEIFLLVLLNIFFPFYYSQFQEGQFFIDITFIVFVLFSLIMHSLTHYKIKATVRGEVYEK